MFGSIPMKSQDYIIEHYRFECQVSPEEAVKHLCEEHSTAQWKRVGVDEDFRPQHGAKLLDLRVVGESDRSVFDSPFNTGPIFYTVEVKMAHPHINFGPKLPNLLTAVCGEGVFYTPGITAIKLLDLEFPEEYLDHFEGPQFGVEGVRDLLGIFDRPLFLGVVKPNIGLKPVDFAELAYQSWLGGLDGPKDDEMLADADYSSIAERSKILGKLKKKAEAETGEKKMFICNITDEVDRIVDLHDLAVANGLNAVMLNSWPIGLSAARMLRKKARVPMVSHFDFIAAFSRLPFFGMSTALATKLQRLAGFDMILFPGVSDRMRTGPEEVLENVKACLQPWGKIKPALPVPGGSDWAGSLPKLYKMLGTIDFGMVPGRGVFSHPGGPRAGAESFRQAWEATKINTSLSDYAKTHPSLKKAMETFGD